MLLDIDICNFASNTTPFLCDQALETVLETQKSNSKKAIFWFENNCMKLNTDKYHLLISGSKYEQIWVEIREDKTWESDVVKLLDAAIENRLNFDSHTDSICLKANQKLRVVGRLAKLLSFRKKLLFKTFFESQFKSCPLVWMFCSRKSVYTKQTFKYF